VTVLAREWTGDPGRVIRCDPFHIGRLWRDWSFARAVCREIARRPFDFVQSHERIACCDIYRAGDGVHAQWLHNRRAILGPLARVSVGLKSLSSLRPRRRAAPVREPAAACRDLQFAHGQR